MIISSKHSCGIYMAESGEANGGFFWIGFEQ
jgi:hypothetical protein